ncbi:hypothetical protein, partial [Staphylococcus epidermidis]|uniref:hypothetical protein n=1 Tax=Staphylococcus epidermidis TaxID=1282 RepID=UPI0037DA5664
MSTKHNPLHPQQKLPTPKTQPINPLNTLAHLNTPHKHSIKTPINTTHTTTHITAQQTKPNQLNTPIHTFTQNISHNQSLTNQTNYINPQPQKQHTFTHPLNNPK